MKNRILYIDLLDYSSLLIGIGSLPFFDRVYFHNAIDPLQSKKTRKILASIGIHWMSFSEIPVGEWCKAFDMNIKFGNRVLKNQFLKTYMYSFLVYFFKMDNVGVKKLDASLKRRVVGNWLNEGTSSFALLQYYFKEQKQKKIYLPSCVGNFLLAYEVDHLNLAPVAIHCLLRETAKSFKVGKILLQLISKKTVSFRQFFKKTVRFSVEQNPSEKPTESPGKYQKYQFAFFPHKNLTYSTFFKKTYLYEEKKDNFFYKEKILTIFDEETDPVSKRYLQFYNIPHVNLQSVVKNEDV
jgi:hypothetical protein